MKIPSIKKVNFFTMVPSVEFGIAVRHPGSGKVPPKKLHSQDWLTFVVCSYRCTGDAKGEHAKSSRYKAKSWSLCKNLHENVLNLRFTPLLTGGSKATRLSAKRLILKDKAQFRWQIATYAGSSPLAGELHIT